MHLALLKALVAVISTSVIAVGVALAPAGNAHHGQLVGGNVKPDAALNLSWTDNVIRHVRDDLDRAERDQAVSPAAARALLGALRTALGTS